MADVVFWRVGMTESDKLLFFRTKASTVMLLKSEANKQDGVLALGTEGSEDLRGQTKSLTGA